MPMLHCCSIAASIKFSCLHVLLHEAANNMLCPCLYDGHALACHLTSQRSSAAATLELVLCAPGRLGTDMQSPVLR